MGLIRMIVQSQMFVTAIVFLFLSTILITSSFSTANAWLGPLVNSLTKGVVNQGIKSIPGGLKSLGTIVGGGTAGAIGSKPVEKLYDQAWPTQNNPNPSNNGFSSFGNSPSNNGFSSFGNSPSNNGFPYSLNP